MKFLCRLFGHKYYVVQELTRESRQLACPRCRGRWGMNDRVKLIVPWTPEMEYMYNEIFGIRIIKPWR